MDEFEKNIRENLADFEAEPSANHELRFAEKLNGNKVEKPWRWAALAAACIAAFITVLNLNQEEITAQESNPKSMMKLSEVSPEMAEVEAFYTEEILTSEVQVKSLTGDASSGKMLQAQLQFLGDQYKLLETELALNPGDERIIKNMIENYRTRLKLLEKHLSMIQKYQQLKSTVNESA